MDDPLHGPLTTDERAALAAWAEHDASEGFADAVMAAWQEEHDQEAAPELVAPGRRLRDPRPSRLRGLVGIGTAVAAAAAVMLMVRVLPRDPGRIASAQACDEATPAAMISDADPLAVELAPSSATSPDAQSILVDDAVAVLTEHCSPCHDGADAGAKPEALGVFDLRQRPFADRMSDEQLREASLRIEELGTASDSQRRRMSAFVDAEIARRAHAG